MGFTENLKIKKIKKFGTKQDAGSIKKYLDDDKYNVKYAAIEALQNIGNTEATEILISRFKQLYIDDTLQSEKIIKALDKINSPQAIDFIRKVYNDYKDQPMSHFSEYAQKVLRKKGSPKDLINQILELNYDLYNRKAISSSTKSVIVNGIKNRITQEDQLIGIVSKSEIFEFANEALKKLKSIDQIPVKKVKEMVKNKIITGEVLLRITEPALIIEILKETAEDSKWYDLFPHIVQRLNALKVETNITEEDQVTCPGCNGEGGSYHTKPQTEDEIYYQVKPEKIYIKCPACEEYKTLARKTYQIAYKDNTLRFRIIYRNNSTIFQISN